MVLPLQQASFVALQMRQPARMLLAHPSLSQDLNRGFNSIPGEFLPAIHSVLPCFVSVPEQAKDTALCVCYRQADLDGTLGRAEGTYFNGVDCKDVTYGTENSQETCKQGGCSYCSDAAGREKVML